VAVLESFVVGTDVEAATCAGGGVVPALAAGAAGVVGVGALDADEVVTQALTMMATRTNTVRIGIGE
jgi:L-serine deaminase